MKTVDTMVVGGGITGLHLVRALQRAGQTVAWWTDPQGTMASRVAAGVLNPITGGRLALSWRIETFLPFARTCYRAMEEELGETFFHELPIRRFCFDAKDRERHAERLADPEYAPYLGPLENDFDGFPQLRREEGSFLIKGVGYVDLAVLLPRWHDRARAAGVLQEELFRWDDLRFAGDELSYGSWRARKIVICEGTTGRENPWFAGLPYRPVKGEIITLRADPGPFPPVLWHHRKWILPLGGGLFRVGSTYQRGTSDAQPTAAGAAELLAGWQAAFRQPVAAEIVNHQAGLRPASHDRHPYVDQHPRIPQLYMANGLGSKGALLAPWVGAHLADHLTRGTPLDPAVQLSRIKPGRWTLGE